MKLATFKGFGEQKSLTCRITPLVADPKTLAKTPSRVDALITAVPAVMRYT